MARPPKQVENIEERNVPEKTPHQIFWEQSAKKGFVNFFIVQSPEDLNNPTEGVITIGWKDANGLTAPGITAPKEAWLALADLLISKYRKQ